MVKLITQAGLLYISPVLPEFQRLLSFELKRSEAVMKDRWINGELKNIRVGQKFVVSEQKLFWIEETGTFIVTYHNLIHRIYDFCVQSHFQVEVEHRTEFPVPMITADTVRDLRPEQVRAFAKMLGTRGGAMLEATMATGKTHIIAALVRAYRHCGQVVVMTFRDAVAKRLVEGLTECLKPDGIEVSIMTGSSKRAAGGNVLICTSGMIGHLDKDRVDVLIFDECHRAAGDKTGQLISHFLKAAKYGLSGTITKRLDGKELWLEAMFGPIADRITDAEAEELDRVSKVKVYALSVPTGPNVRDIKQPHILEERAITLNAARNTRIRQVVELSPPDQQLIIFVRTEAHINELMEKYLTGFQIFHSGMPESEKKRIQAGIESGEILRIISTDCLEEGIDTTELSILIDANWTTSDRSVSQKGGRNRRKKDGKRWGVIVNFQDEWCDLIRKRALAKSREFFTDADEELGKTDRLKSRADTRLRQYRERGWPVERIAEASEIVFDVGQDLPEEEVQQEMSLG